MEDLQDELRGTFPIPHAHDLLCWVTAQADNQSGRRIHPWGTFPNAAVLERKHHCACYK